VLTETENFTVHSENHKIFYSTDVEISFRSLHLLTAKHTAELPNAEEEKQSNLADEI
jgi:hypothetical protein